MGQHLPPQPSATGRDTRIDQVRGLSIALVLLLHYALAYGTANFPLRAALGPRLTAALFYNGNYGVTIFFAVSGYLITGMSLQRWGTPAGIVATDFYRLRAARVLPCLLLALLLITVPGLAGVRWFGGELHGHALSAGQFALALLSVLGFWHNLLMQSWGWFHYCLNIYWSLSVEEVFYLAFPLVAIATRRPRWLALPCLLLVLAGPLYRSAHAADELYYECGYLACFDAIAMGCLAALVARQRPPPAHAAWLRALRLGCMASWAGMLWLGIGDHEVAGFTVVAASAALFLWSCAAPARTSPGAVGRAVAWLGSHSYELYLLHIVVLATMRNLVARDSLGPATWCLWLVLFLAASMWVAALAARFVSDPLNRALRYRLRLPPSATVPASRPSS